MASVTHCQEAVGEEFPEEIKLNSKSLRIDTLLNTDDDSPQISEVKSNNALIMKGALLVKKVRLDLELGLAFLASIVRVSAQQG